MWYYARNLLCVLLLAAVLSYRLGYLGSCTQILDGLYVCHSASPAYCLWMMNQWMDSPAFDLIASRWFLCWMFVSWMSIGLFLGWYDATLWHHVLESGYVTWCCLSHKSAFFSVLSFFVFVLWIWLNLSSFFDARKKWLTEMHCCSENTRPDTV